MHLRHSSISAYEECPRKYRLQYVDCVESGSNVAARLGTAAHKALELIYRPLVDDPLGLPAPAVESWATAWAASGLIGAELYAEGLAMVRPHATDQLLRELPLVATLEQAFELPLPGGRHVLTGTMDRVDVVDDGEAIEVIDYKSNHALYTRDEVDGSLQLALYEAGARSLWTRLPVRSCYVMLRHDTTQRRREDAALTEAALLYAAHMGDVMAADTVCAPRLNNHCGWCEYREQCGLYLEALRGDTSVAINKRNLDQVAAERERVKAVAKAAGERCSELNEVLRTAVQEFGELRAAGMRYSFSRQNRVTYPVDAVLESLQSVGVPTARATMSRAEVHALLTGLPERLRDAALLSLDEHQQVSSYPVFQGRKVRA